jgi:spoIIIJ-associated protein
VGHQEFEGASEHEAVEAARRVMGFEGSDLDYTVVDEGSAGVFGIGSRPVRIRVRLPKGVQMSESSSDGDNSIDEGTEERVPYGPAPEKAARAEEVARGLLERMGVDAQITVRDEDRDIVVVIEEAEGKTDVQEVLGGSRPPAVPALQFLLNKIVNRFPDDRKHISIEAPSVPKRAPKVRSRDDAPAASSNAARSEMPTLDALKSQVDPELDPDLVELAYEVAQKALSVGKVLTIHPMQAADRRTVHQAVTALPGVQTQSEGEGLYRRMHIVPDGLAGGDGSKRKRKRRRRRPGRADAPAAR